MKKLSALLTAALLLTSLTACNDKEPPASSQPVATTTTTTATSAAPTEPTASETTASATATGTKKPTSTRPTKTTTTKPPATTTTTATAKKIVRVTIPEGFTMKEIFERLAKNNVSTFDDLMKSAKNDTFDFPLLKAQPNTANRCFKLEGYLFPDTYEFYTNAHYTSGRADPKDAINKMLSTGQSRINAAISGKTDRPVDEILTVASLIEAEGANPNEMSKISAIIYNRLQKKMKLELDATVVYLENSVRNYCDMSKWDAYREAYNTKKCKALPAGPICSPGLKAINAALHPAAVDYLFFCNDKKTENPTYYYATTYEEHQQNLIKAGLVKPPETSAS